MIDSIKRFFGIRPESSRIRFDSPVVVESVPSMKDQSIVPGVAQIPVKKVKSRGLSYFSGGGRSSPIAPQYDHVEIEAVTDIEGFFARAISAKLALFCKEGWDFVGQNDQRVRYLKTRVSQIERVTDVPFFNILVQLARNLTVHSNAFLLKVRDVKASGGRIRKEGARSVKPIAGYFSLPPESMYPEIDEYGNITGWTQYTQTGHKRFSTQDVVHLYMNKKDGYPLGVPRIVSGLDDIHALRHIEESVEVLIRKNLFPLILFRVGTEDVPAGVNPDGTREVDVLAERISDMPTEGALVVPERYDAKAIGSEGRAMRVEGYINHFRERVFANLDMSTVDMGIGGTASRSSASTMSRNLVDVVKFLQTTVQGFFDLFVVQELLKESTFDQPTLLTEENLVHLKFKEIDTETKTAKENHVTNLFNNNMVTFNEARSQMGLEPLSDEEEAGLWWNKFGREQSLIRSIDENSGSGKPEVAATDQPQNQHGERSAPKLNRDSFRDSFVSKTVIDKKNPITQLHLSLRDEVLDRVKRGTYNKDTIKLEVETTYSMIFEEFIKEIRASVREVSGVNLSPLSYLRDETIDRRVRFSINRLKSDLINRLEDGTVDAEHIFNALLYRTKSIYQTEKSFARNLSSYYLAKQYNKNVIIVGNETTSCEHCKAKLTIIQHNDTLAEDKLPPHHPGCECGIRVVAGD